MVDDAETRDEFLSLMEAEVASGVPRRTLSRLIVEGRLPSFGVARDRQRRFIRRRDLDALTVLAPLPARRLPSEGSSVAA